MEKIYSILFIAGLVFFSSCESEEVNPKPHELEFAMEGDEEEDNGNGGTLPPPGPEPPPAHNNLRALAEYYSPLVWLHNYELNFPSSVEWYLSVVDMMYSGGHFWDTFLVEENPTVQNIHDIHFGVWNSGSTTNNMFNLRHISTAVRYGNITQAKYYVYSYEHYGKTRIQYWVFYPYNGDTEISIYGIFNAKAGAHEGDWEHIEIEFLANSNVPSRVFFSAHGDGQWKNWNEVDKSGYHHPVAYSAKGSHAFYPTSGNHTRWPWPGIIFYDKTNKGTSFLMEGKLEFVEDESNNPTIFPTDPNWLRYKGRWGVIEGDNTDSNPWGPRGPNHGGWPIH